MTSNDMIDILIDLMEASRDGQWGFIDASKHASCADLRDIFAARAEDCACAISELKVLLGQCGGREDGADKVVDVVSSHRIACDDKFDRCTDLTLLEACERREDVAEAHYRQALDKMLPEPVRSFVEHQYQGVRRNHEQMRRLRDRFRAALAH